MVFTRWAKIKINLLKETFGERNISHHGHVARPPKSYLQVNTRHGWLRRSLDGNPFLKKGIVFFCNKAKFLALASNKTFIKIEQKIRKNFIIFDALMEFP